jgi:hypothetical protein
MSGLETLAIAGIVAGVAGAAGSIYEGYQTQQAAYEAARRDERAGQAEFAASQREAEERRLEGEIIMSRQQAAAAASGGGAGSDAPTIVRLMTESAKRARYGQESTLFGGRSRKQTYIETAQSRRATGDANFLGSILTGIGQTAEAFNNG